MCSRLVLCAALASALACAQSGWVPRIPPSSPGAGGGYSLAYDSARSRAVLLADASFPNASGTWEWDGLTWQDRAPVPEPSARRYAAAAYDAARGVTVIFGGIWPSAGALGDTWEWDGATWTQRSPATSPAPRLAHAMTYDAAAGRVVLFGGADANSNALSDTWEWDGVSWILRVTPVNPSPRLDHAMCYDAARQRVVLFGGISAAPVGTFLGDTWEWDGTSWSQMAGPGPAPRRSHGMAYHPGVGLSVLFAGETAGLGPLADTWTWDGVTWVPLTTAPSPPPRQALTLVYDASCGQILTFGWGLPPFTGCGPCYFSNDTWHLELQPVAGPGQANSAGALLDVGGSCWAAGSAGGPFAATLPSGGSGALGFGGTPGMPLILFAGPQNANPTTPPCLGIPSIGTPPLFTDLVVLFDGLQDPTFTLDITGQLKIPFAVPALPPGPFANVQALMVQPPGSPCPAVLTAAFFVAIQ